MSTTFWRNTHVASLAVFLTLSAIPALAQNPHYPGYLGVYVYENDHGMEIADFLPRTPAARLAARGQLHAGDTIVRLAGRRTSTIGELRSARNTIPYGKEGKMVLRQPGGGMFYVWISRNRPAAAAAAAAREQADTFRYGGKGAGEDEKDIRDIQGDKDDPADDTSPDIRDKSPDEGR